MGQFYDQIPEELKGHVKEITRTSGLPDTEESLEEDLGGVAREEEGFRGEDRGT